MRYLYCPECGERLRKLGFYGDGDHEYQCTGCHICVEYNFKTKEFTYILYDDTDDEMPECCVACGCDLYPDCQASCKIFDDD